jgi:hypothetical protein
MRVNNIEWPSTEENKDEESSEFTFEISSSHRESGYSFDIGANFENDMRNVEIIEEVLSIEERLNSCPPDFILAKKHRECNMAKPHMPEKDIKDFNDEDLYCEWCHRPTDKAIKKFNLCVKIRDLGDLGVGIPLYFSFKRINILIFFWMSIWMIYSLITNSIKTEGKWTYNYLFEPGYYSFSPPNIYFLWYYSFYECNGWHEGNRSCKNRVSLYEWSNYGPIRIFRWTDGSYRGYANETYDFRNYWCSKEDFKSKTWQDERGQDWVENNEKDDRSLVRWASMREYKWSLIYYETYEIILQQFFNWVCMAIIVLFSFVLNKNQTELINEMDAKHVTPSDFCVFISNLPTDKNPDQIKAWLKSLYPNIDIVYVNFCYNVYKVVRAEKKLRTLQKMKNYVTSYKEKILKELKIDEEEANERKISLMPQPVTRYFVFKFNFIPAPILEVYIDKFERLLSTMKKDMSENTQNYTYCGNAFVVVNKQSEAEKLIEDFEISTIVRVYAFVVNKILCCKRLKYKRKLWEGKNINIERAEEPTDYYWENLSIKTKFRVKRSILTFFLNFWALAIALAAYTIIYQLVFEVVDPQIKHWSKAKRDVITRIALTFNSLLTMVVNGILCRIGRFLSYVERHETMSKYRSSQGFKLTIVLFINSCMIPMLLNWIIAEEGKYFVRVASDIYSLTVSLSFYEPVLQLLSTTWLVKKWRIRRELKRGEKSILSQRQANFLFEGVEFLIAERYAKTMLLFLIVCFFSYPIPLIPFVAFGGSVFQYMVDKYLLLRRCKVPEQMGPSIAQTFSTLLPFGCVIYATSLLYFANINYSNSSHRNLGISLLVLSVVYFFLPLNFLIKYFKKDVEESQDQEKTDPTYRESRLLFTSDYNRVNPVTQREARHAFLRRLRLAGRISAQQYEEQKEAIEESILSSDLVERPSEELNYHPIPPNIQRQPSPNPSSSTRPPPTLT